MKIRILDETSATFTSPTYTGICSGMQAVSSTPLLPLSEYIESVGRAYDQIGRHLLTFADRKSVTNPLLPAPPTGLELEAKLLVEGLIAHKLARREYDSLGDQIHDIAQRWLKAPTAGGGSISQTLEQLSSLAFRLHMRRPRAWHRSQDCRAILKALHHLDYADPLYPKFSQETFAP
jgi:hypothetical protein